VLGDQRPESVVDYFRSDPSIVEGPGSRDGESSRIPPGRRIEWQHQLDKVLGALMRCGLRLQLFHEWGVTYFQQFPWLVAHPDGGRLWTSGGPGALPLLYSVKAVRPSE
jgi:hypothetical protein